jgi:hypothetical protein
MGRLAEAALPSNQQGYDAGAAPRSWGDRLGAAFYRWLGSGTKGDLIRLATGGGPCAWQVARGREMAKEEAKRL